MFGIRASTEDKVPIWYCPYGPPSPKWEQMFPDLNILNRAVSICSLVSCCYVGVLYHQLRRLGLEELILSRLDCCVLSILALIDSLISSLLTWMTSTGLNSVTECSNLLCSTVDRNISSTVSSTFLTVLRHLAISARVLWNFSTWPLELLCSGGALTTSMLYWFFNKDVIVSELKEASSSQ